MEVFICLALPPDLIYALCKDTASYDCSRNGFVLEFNNGKWCLRGRVRIRVVKITGKGGFYFVLLGVIFLGIQTFSVYDRNSTLVPTSAARDSISGFRNDSWTCAKRIKYSILLYRLLKYVGSVAQEMRFGLW